MLAQAAGTRLLTALAVAVGLSIGAYLVQGSYYTLRDFSVIEEKVGVINTESTGNDMNIKQTQAVAMVTAALLQACGGGVDAPSAGSAARAQAQQQDRQQPHVGAAVGTTRNASTADKVIDDGDTPLPQQPPAVPAEPAGSNGTNGAEDFGYLRRGLTASVAPGLFGGTTYYVDVVSNPNTGDTPVDVSLPILCYYLDYSLEYWRYYSDYWTELRATPPIPGYLLTSPTARDGSLGHAECVKAHGPNWFMVDAWLASSQYGTVDVNTRYWIAATAPANPWNSPGDTPAGFSDEWTYCAAERSNCNFAGRKLVHYGMGTRLVSKVFTPSPFANYVTCDTSSFGIDPAPNVVKGCWISEAPLPPPPSLSAECYAYSAQLTCQVRVSNDNAQDYDFRWYGNSSLQGQSGQYVQGSCQRGSTVFVRVEGTNRVTGYQATSMTTLYCAY